MVATAWFAVLTWPWVRALRVHPARPLVRSWVDDLSLHARGEQEAMEVVGLATRHLKLLELGTGLRVNREKSAVLGATKQLRVQLRVVAEEYVSKIEGPVKDLGVVHGQGQAARRRPDSAGVMQLIG